jgi:hypothetical protein
MNHQRDAVLDLCSRRCVKGLKLAAVVTTRGTLKMAKSNAQKKMAKS